MAAKEFPLSIVIRTVNRVTAGLQGVGKNIDAFAKRVGRVGTKLTAGLTVPIIGLGAAGVAATAKFEKGMSDVSTLIDTNTESLAAMERQVLKIGRRVPVDMGELTSALFDIRSAGTPAAKALGVLENSGRLAVAGLGTTQQAADLVTSSINAFGLEGEKAERIYDVVFKTTKNGKTTIAGLAQGFGAVAGTVAASGTELDEYLASVAALTTTGLPAAQAHTQLRSVISGLTRDTKETRFVFRNLGVKDFKGLIRESGGLVKALRRIHFGLDGNEAEILKLVGSSEALNAILGLTGAQGKVFTDTLDDMRNGANALDAAFEKQNATQQAQWKRTKNALTSAAVSIGRVLNPVLTKLSKKLQAVADWFESLDSETREWIVGIAAVGAAIGPVLIILAKLITAIRVVSLTLIGTPFGLVLVSIAGIAAAVVVLSRNWDSMSRKAKIVAGVLLHLMGPIGWVIGGLTALVKNASRIKDAWSVLADFFRELWDTIKGIFQEAWEFIKGIVDKIVGAVDKVVGGAKKVGRFAKGAAGIVADGASSAADFVFGKPARLDTDLAGLSGLAGAGRAARAAVKVRFENAPPGTRTEIEPGSDADVELDTGHQLVTE